MAKPRHFFYRFEDIPPLNKETVRVQVTKHLHESGDESPQSTYEVWGSPDQEDGDGRLVCDCPSSQYRAVHGRCKHVEWVEELIEMRTETFGQQFYYSTELEGWIKQEN
jgi:hypothetical protein